MEASYSGMRSEWAGWVRLRSVEDKNNLCFATLFGLDTLATAFAPASVSISVNPRLLV